MKSTPLREFAQLINVKCFSTKNATSVAIDTRKIKAGALFFALPGMRVDGHQFLEKAASEGAVGAVVAQDYKGNDFGLDLIRVPDVLLALQEMGRKTLQKRKPKIVAITGSLGKTTTKEFTASLLAGTYKIAKTPLSYNTQSTLPLSILMMEGDEEICVLEMGMTHPGDIRSLVSIAPPDIAVLTSVAFQHANNFPDGLSGIAQEKGAIFSTSHTQVGILHKDTPHFSQLYSLGNFPKKTFSLKDNSADYYFEGGTLFCAGEVRKIPLVLPLKPHYLNFLAAVAVARECGVSWEQIEALAPTLKLPPQRFEEVRKKGIHFINDAYNANPDALTAALEHLPQPQEGGRKIAVISEMDALGEHTEKGHLLVGECALKHIDFLLCIGSKCKGIEELWKHHAKPAFRFQNKEEMLQALKELAKPGDVVLLKGARAYALEELVEKF